MLRRAHGLRAIGSCGFASSNVTQLAKSLHRLNLLNAVSQVELNASRSIQAVGATLGRRLFATANAATQTDATGLPVKEASEKKTATPRAKKTATTKSTTSKAAATKKPKTAAKAKPKKAAKPKKKVVKPKKKVAKAKVKVVKPKKRVLSEAGKLKREKRAKLDETKALRATALFEDEPPRFPYTPFTQFIVEFKGENKYPDFEQRAHVVAEQYKALSSTEIQELKQRASDVNDKQDKAYAEWVSKHTPTQIVVANNARRLLRQRGVIKKQRYLMIPDERVPKRPQGPYIQFVADRFASGDLKNTSISESGKRLGKEWQALDAGGKQKYQDLFEADQKRYEREYKSVFGAAPSETDTASL